VAQKAVRAGENAIRKAAHHSPENQIIRDSAGELVSKTVEAVAKKVAEKRVAKGGNPHVPYSTAVLRNHTSGFIRSTFKGSDYLNQTI
jgi:hypothetical protein